MRTIVKGREPIASLWCTATRTSGRFRLMRYIVRTECEGGILLLNTVTGELVQLSSEEKSLLEFLPQPYVQLMDELIARRFLVPESFDELSSVIQLRKVLRCLSFPDNSVVGYTILPTTTCNARCFYCYESDYPHHSMSNDIAEQLVDYIESRCGKAKKVHISWFGGEPTIGEKHIDYVCESLKKKGIAFTSSMISNGYLFSKEMAHKAKEKWCLENIQITLDGTEAIYNGVKAYLNPVGSPYQRVINNIGYLLDEKIRVSIRMNLDRHNADNLKELVDELALKFQHDSYFSIYVHEIFEGMGYEPVQRSEKGLQDIIEIKQEIDSYIDSKGLNRAERSKLKELPFLKTTFCMADNPSSLLVNPDGKLGKCQHMQFDHLIGDIWGGKAADKEGIQYWMEYQYKKGCDDCPLLPACGVPETCASGRPCIPAERDSKLEAIRVICRDTVKDGISVKEE